MLDSEQCFATDTHPSVLGRAAQAVFAAGALYSALFGGRGHCIHPRGQKRRSSPNDSQNPQLYTVYGTFHSVIGGVSSSGQGSLIGLQVPWQ